MAVAINLRLLGATVAPLLLLSLQLLSTEAVETSTCQSGLEDLRSTFQGVFGEDYNISINCISFDENSAMKTAIVSGFEGTTSMRYRFECKGGVPVAFVSAVPANDTEDVSGCLSCIDNVTTCNEDCADECARCYQLSTNCTLCTAKEYVQDEDPEEEECVKKCDDDEQPNPDRRNVCEFTCQGNQVIKLDRYDPAIDAEDLGEDYSHPDEEALLQYLANIGGGASCEDTCTNVGYEAAEETNICFACGLEYCFACDEHEQTCTTCVRRTALYEGECVVGTTADLVLIAELQELEVEEEERENDLNRIELAVSLPITCVAVIVFFVIMAVIAHYRYPHISHHGNKRHRRKTENTEQLSEDEKVWRTRPTVRLR